MNIDDMYSLKYEQVEAFEMGLMGKSMHCNERRVHGGLVRHGKLKIAARFGAGQSILFSRSSWPLSEDQQEHT